MITYQQVREFFRYNKRTGAFVWRVQRRGRGGLTEIGQMVGDIHGGYRRTCIGGRAYQVHRLIWLYVTGHWPTVDIDHKNGVRHDNRWSNLREAHGSINQENFRRPFRNNQSRLIGAWPSSDGKKWRSVIQVSRKRVFLGYFGTAMDAHLAYVKAKRKLHKGCTI
jgi:hypothetical protein